MSNIGVVAFMAPFVRCPYVGCLRGLRQWSSPRCAFIHVPLQNRKGRWGSFTRWRCAAQARGSVLVVSRSGVAGSMCSAQGAIACLGQRVAARLFLAATPGIHPQVTPVVGFVVLGLLAWAFEPQRRALSRFVPGQGDEPVVGVFVMGAVAWIVFALGPLDGVAIERHRFGPCVGLVCGVVGAGDADVGLCASGVNASQGARKLQARCDAPRASSMIVSFGASRM